jgi:predicted transcriptional regulator
MSIKSQGNTEMKYLRWLTEIGQEDIHVIQRETAERVLTPERIRLLNAIKDEKPNSVRELARVVDRHVSVVSDDLNVLFEADIVEYETEGRSKRPLLAHENVFVQPVVFDGDVMAGDD